MPVGGEKLLVFSPLVKIYLACLDWAVLGIDIQVGAEVGIQGRNILEMGLLATRNFGVSSETLEK